LLISFVIAKYDISQ